MNVDQVLQSVQDFRSQLEVWGITSQALWFAGVAASILFTLSLREVASWYFRINLVRSEVRALRKQIKAMQQAQEETLEILSNLTPGVTGPDKKQEPSTAALFRFDH